MLPNIDLLLDEITETTYPSRTYRIVLASEINPGNQNILSINLSTEVNSFDRISGYIDDIKAVTQAAYLILCTERYKHLIYSWDYGVELVDLMGKPMTYVMAELPRRVKEALTMDDRIDDVIDFEFEPKKHKLFTTFTIISNVGNISAQMEVSV
jgi:hypothetical protein